MKRKIFTLLIIFILTSCSSKDSQPIGLVDFETKDFSMGVPTSWDIIDNKEEILPTPRVGELVLATTSQDLMYGFSNTMIVLKQDLSKPTTSLNFSTLNNVGAQTKYLEYTKLSSKNISFSDADVSYLYIFEAKYNLETPKLKFLQIGKTCNYNTGYLITIALSTNVRDTDIYEQLIKTFKCK